MNKNLRMSVPGVALLWAGLSGAAELGEYKPSLSADQFFQQGNGRVLQRDLSFSVPGRETIVAPQGLEVEQTLPPVVWQYSGLLPVSSYLKTAAIHSVSSDLQDRSWQDVQLNFYSGLLVEGANIVDAQIAFAGAYAFAPRWPLVELIQVSETQSPYPETILYRVAFSEEAGSGFTLEEYRALALRILQEPEDISLEEIKATIDSADFIDGGQLASLDVTNNSDTKADNVADTRVGSTPATTPAITADTPVDSKGSADVADNSGGVRTSGNSRLIAGDNTVVGAASDQSASNTEAAVADSGTNASQQAATAAGAAATAADIANSGKEAADQLVKGNKASDDDTGAKLGTNASGLVGGVAQTGAAAAGAAVAAGDESAKQGDSKEDDEKDNEDSDSEDSDDENADESGDEESGDEKDKGDTSDAKRSAVATAAGSAAAGSASAASAAAVAGAAVAGVLPQSSGGSDSADAPAESSDQAVKAQASSGDQAAVNRTTTTGFIPAPVSGGRVIPLTAETLSLDGTATQEKETGVFGPEVFENGEVQELDGLTSPATPDQLQQSQGVKIPLEELFIDDPKPQDPDDAAGTNGVSNDSASTGDYVTGSSIPPVDEKQMDELDGQVDEWVVLPDGSLVLRSSSKDTVR